MGLLGALAKRRIAPHSVGPSLEDMIDGYTMAGSGDLIVGALRRAGVNLSKREAAGLFAKQMPQLRLPVGKIRPTDGVPPEDYWVRHYLENPDHNPIVVRRRMLGGYDIIDGHHRHAAAKKRGAGDIEAYDASLYF